MVEIFKDFFWKNSEKRLCQHAAIDANASRNYSYSRLGQKLLKFLQGGVDGDIYINNSLLFLHRSLQRVKKHLMPS